MADQETRRDQTASTLQEGEHALEESEERYRLLFTNMTAGFAVHELLYDEGGVPVDYRFLDANPAFESLTGLSIAAIRGRTARDVMPGLEQRWIETYGRVVQTQAPTLFRMLLPGARGRLRCG